MSEELEPFLSVVIPAYNEEARIGESLRRIIPYLRSLHRPFELIVVDDGSRDGTIEVVRGSINGCDRVRILRNKRNRGKGYAVRRGMLEAKGKYVLFTDADLSTPIDELGRFLTWLNDGYDIAIGSRRVSGARIEVHQPLLRETMGKIFAWLTNFLLVKDISDITCGFKCFRRSVARDLFSRQKLSGWSFDAEILFIAKRRGYKIKEVPIRWRDSPGTKVKMIKDAIKSFWELLQIRLNDWRGLYGR